MAQVNRILAAVSPDSAARVRRILSEHDLRIVHQLADARAALEHEAVGLIFIGARFDESRMFDLLDAAIARPSQLSGAAIEGLRHSTKIYGASVFINLKMWSRKPGRCSDATRLRVEPSLSGATLPSYRGMELAEHHRVIILKCAPR